MQNALQGFHMSKAGGKDKAAVRDDTWVPSLWLIGAVLGSAACGYKSQ